MPGVRINRFLASTAVGLVLALGPVCAFADSVPPSGSDNSGAAATTASPATPSQADNAAPTADGSAPAATAPAPQPSEAASQPADVAPAPAAPATESTAVTEPAPAAAAANPAPAAPSEGAPAAAEATPAEKPAETAAKPAQPNPDSAAVPAPVDTTATVSPPPAPAAASVETPTPSVATAPAAAPVVADGNTAIADQLRGITAGKFDRVIGSKKDRTVIDAFYSGRDYAPIWLTDGKANARAKAAIAYLGHVEQDGLDPADYPVPNFAALTDPAELADAELRLSMSVITYAHHAAVGRVHWSRVSPDIEFTNKAPEPADVLASMVDSKDIPTVLDAYEPHTPQYLALKAKLAEIRAGKADPSKPSIPNGPTLKVGSQDDRVPELRDRLGVTGDGNTYDKPLAEAVRKFQQQHDLKGTGTLTMATVEAMNGRQPDRPTDIIIANMERWRWMPHDLGSTYVIVNLPDYTLRVMHDGKQVWMTRIVIGKPDKPTPLMTAEMKYITVNPTWNVPPSIVNHEYLPALAQDPTVLERMGLKVGHNPDGSVHIWQPPGDRNALGRIRFNFPNKFLVYQHDTPDKYLFAYDKRAYSHGCMRVQDPQKYAEVLLSLVRPNDGYTVERIKRMIAEGSETDIQFPTFIPVNLTYQTAFVDDQGKLEFRDDIYGRDRKLLALLKSDDRMMADVPVEHHEDIARRQALAIPDGTPITRGAGGRYGSRSYYPDGQPDGGNFFSRLFGGFNEPAPQPVRRAASPHRRESRSATTVER